MMAQAKQKQTSTTTLDDLLDETSCHPLVWISFDDGRQQEEPALLIEDYDEMHLIQWKNSGKQDFVECHRVSHRRKRPLLGCTRTGNTFADAATCTKDATDTVPAESDDDEVQLLLTISPPSPKKPKQRTTQAITPLLDTPHIVATCTPSSDNPTTRIPQPLDSVHEVDQDIPLNRTLWSDNSILEDPISGSPKSNSSDSHRRCSLSIESTTTQNNCAVPSEEPTIISESTTSTDQASRFSFRTSAYVQSLAEICHAILWDARWRVGGSRQERLLAWESGHDLSAVHALSRLYLPVVSVPSPLLPCQCLLCDPDFFSREQTDTTCHTTTSLDADLHQGETTTTTTSNRKGGTQVSELSQQDDTYDRAINLYARLYNRKGPWFRVDDLFKYYLPKHRIDPTVVTQDNTNPPSPIKHSSPSQFFLPKKISNLKVTKSIDSYLDQDYINQQLAEVTTLLQDVQQLARMGLLRSFHSEQECGQTIGRNGKYELLRQEEQRSILAKLGGGASKQSKRVSNNDKATNNTENLIWKQMCQQQSILGQQASTKPTTVLLPVCKHVDKTLIASWATNLVLRASCGNYIPQGIMRSVIEPVQNVLQQLVSDYLGGSIKTSMCWRLREAPLESLRRCCRLYLCATSGPGAMRGDTGTNAWKSLPHEVVQSDNEALPFPTNVVAPPGSLDWHHMMIPGRDLRFKLISCFFQRAHQPLLLHEPSSIVQTMTEDEIQQVQVFPTVNAFELWELSVAFRSTVDYLLEANELSLYNERKRLRELKSKGQAINELGVEPDSIPNAINDKNVPGQKTFDSPVDFMNVLKQSGRRQVLVRFASGINTSPKSILELERCVDTDIAALLGMDRLINDFERVLGVIAMIAANVLSLRNQVASQQEINRIVRRPWLRHLWWEGCMAYLLWDIIPILERRGYYELATKSLEILLFGRYQPRDPSCSTMPLTLTSDEASFLAQSYLSRRARGKAFERIVTDYMHILRQQQKQSERTRNTKCKRKRGQISEASSLLSVNDRTARLCAAIIQSNLTTGQITFSAARTLARRLKQPLSQTLSDLTVYEVKELGHRLSSCHDNINDTDLELKKKNGKYSDWTPKTDYAIANAMTIDRNISVGGRCCFVGFEDKEESPTSFSSLNVEELAMEYYNTGRLPEQQASTLRGGWVGWHDEGGKLRALFRILASTAVLGTDWGCPHDTCSNIQKATIHLTPYQGAPFDLHVGAEHSDADNGNVREGFLARRRTLIDRFLSRLEGLDPSQVANLVYQSVYSRWQYAIKTTQSDPTLERDIQQVRTLSALAAGLGGKLLSAICRCLFFDYRHYSGGLPDLTLFRAVYKEGEISGEESLVDLGCWIGESFSPEQLAEKRAQHIVDLLEDQDDEFLGCSKIGDSGPRSNRSGRGRRRMQQQEESTTQLKDIFPDQLCFEYEGQHVKVECMLVEVKSQNDRLDPRQEDWLNVLDRFGDVRVCKFVSNDKAQTKTKTNGKKNTPSSCG